MTATQLTRTTFRTSRQLDFLSARELTLQCGYGVDAWPLVVLKELLDNALDACEEQTIAPEITVTVAGNDTVATIEVADNGAGIPPDAVEDILDFTIRVSSREAYVAPDRGAQGNALKTIVAMPFVLAGGESGRIDIAGQGVRNEISFSVDRIRQQPKAEITHLEEPGSFVRVYLPEGTSFIEAVGREFLQVADDYTFLNPHLTLTVDWFGEITRIEATRPGWSKWRPSNPTSAHWYQVGELARLAGAYLSHDLDNGHQRTVREFVSEFRGLSATAKQKQVLEQTGLARAPLSALVAGDDIDYELAGRLLEAMREHSKPVEPKALGLIGREHVQTRMLAIEQVVPDSFQYTKTLGYDQAGLPQVTEVGFAAIDRAPIDWRTFRRFVCGVNWSASWLNPFRALGDSGRSLDSMLADLKAEATEPIVVLIHVAHPHVQYRDRGKSSVATTGGGFGG
jgi:hypothetical protein